MGMTPPPDGVHLRANWPKSENINAQRKTNRTWIIVHRCVRPEHSRRGGSFTLR